LNAGIIKMTGEWFKWISADDYLEKNAVEELINGAKVVGNESKNLILNQLTKEKRKNYLQALKDYKKTQPLSIRMRSYFRDFLFNYFPKGVFYVILKLYLRIKSKYVISN